MFQSDLLKDKRILVTGGGTGLGRSMAHRFLELGANVVICGRREDVLKQTAEAEVTLAYLFCSDGGPRIHDITRS